MEKGLAIHNRMVRSVELVLAALLGAILGNILSNLWASKDPFNLTAFLLIIIFLGFVMFLVFLFHTLVAWTHKIIYKK